MSSPELKRKRKKSRKLNFRNLKKDSKKVGTSQIEDDVDECLEENICGLNAGCQNTIGSYICICPDLKPVDEFGECDRDRQMVSKNVKDTASSFSSEKLFQIVNSGRVEKGVNTSTNVSSTNKGETGNSTNSMGYSTLTVATMSPTLVTIIASVTVVSVLLMVIVLVVVTLSRRRKNYKEECQAMRSPNKATGQHATNPNYYTDHEDISFLKQLKIVEIRRQKIAFIGKIGEGCFGTVYKGSYTKENPDIGILVAIKILKNSVHSENGSDFEREVDILSSFDHKNIIKLLGVVTQDVGETPWMIFEYMRYGDLTEFLRQGSNSSSKNIYRLLQTDLMFIAQQIAEGMLYLSEQHFVHRDLATRNCLVGDGLAVKISDFGMSRDIYTCDYYKIGGSRMLPVRWMAPESVMYGKFTLQSDAWSFGVVLWEIFSYGKQPYYGHSNEQVVKLILQETLLALPTGCPPLIRDIMKACWRSEPNDRATFSKINKMLNVRMGKCKEIGGLVEIENYLVPDVHITT